MNTAKLKVDSYNRKAGELAKYERVGERIKVTFLSEHFFGGTSSRLLSQTDFDEKFEAIETAGQS
jgi:hypothetical protein